MVGSDAAEPQRPVDDKFIRMSGFAGCWNCSAPLPGKGCKSALVKGSLLLPGLYWFRVLKTYWYKLTTEVASGGTVQKLVLLRCTAGDLRGFGRVLWLLLFDRSNLSLLNEPFASAALCCSFLEGVGVPRGLSYFYSSCFIGLRVHGFRYLPTTVVDSGGAFQKLTFRYISEIML
jgi:hypothetical protein